MNQNDKCDLLKNTIEKLFSKEGRSKVYISKLLGINRKLLSQKIRDWNLELPKPSYHMKPSTEKFINSNREYIKSKLDKDIDATVIAKELKISRGLLTKVAFKMDPILRKANEAKNNRMKIKAYERKQFILDKYKFDVLPNEEWKDILGYPNYQVSNKGRVRRYLSTYNIYHLLTPYLNPINNRYYIRMGNKNLNLSRIIAHAFCEGYSSINNTVDHIDGDTLNNDSSNLRWVSQSENNKHAYKLGRKVNKAKPINYIIKYKNKYEFKTIAAFARFLNLSWTEAKRWIDNSPSKHEIILIRK